MPPPTELVDGRWQVIGAGRTAAVSAPRRIARHSARAAGPAAVGAGVGGAGTLACYATGWPAGLFGPDRLAAGESRPGSPGEGGGVAPGASAGWPGGLPDLSPSIIGGGLLDPGFGSSPFPGPTAGPGGNAGGGGGGFPSRPGVPDGSGQPPAGPGGEETVPSGPDGPGGPGQTVPVPEPQAVALFLGFLVLFATVTWMRRRHAAQPRAGASSAPPSRHPRPGPAAAA